MLAVFGPGVFGSSAPIGQGQAVYLDASAALIAEADLPAECAKAFTRLDSGAVAFGPAELSGAAPLRLTAPRLRATKFMLAAAIRSTAKASIRAGQSS